MKKYFYIVLLFAVSAYSRVFAANSDKASWGVETNGICMSIQLDDSSRTNTETHNIILLFNIKNISTNKTFEIYESNVVEYSHAYSFEITFPSGKKLSLPPGGRSGSGAFSIIRPQRIKEFKFRLSDIFNFNETGDYQIIAKRTMVEPETGKVFVLTSNLLKVHIAYKSDSR